MIAPKFSSIFLLSLATCVLLIPLHHGASLPLHNNARFAKRAPAACCQEAGLFCGNELPSDCGMAAGSLYDCTVPGGVPQLKPLLNTLRCPAVLCEWELHASDFDGNIYGYNTRDNTKKRLIYANKDTGRTYSIAVNSLGVEFKSNSSGSFSGTEDNHWTAHQGLVPKFYGGVLAYGALPDKSFVFASDYEQGEAFFHTSEGTNATRAKFTNQPGNTREFCTAKDNSCIHDIAIDGNGYAWIIGKYGDLYISTGSQLTVQGGPVKHIGRIKGVGEATVAGIAFDNLGHVYYGAENSNNILILKANMVTPTETSIFIQGEPLSLSDLASCAFPKTDISRLM